MFTIVEATDEERDWAGQLLARTEPWITLGSGLKQCLKVARDKTYRLFIARVDKMPCGALILHPNGLAGSPYIKSIVVEESFRSQQIGSRMIAFAENLFKQDSKHLFLCVSSFNAKAQKLYKRLGYQQVGEFNDYIIQGESELLLHKALR